MNNKKTKERKNYIPKSPTGIKGLDEITYGGLPKNRPTLVTGKAGCGKTILSIEFLINGAREFNEPGLFFAFEESASDLNANVAPLGWDIKKLSEEKKFLIEQVQIDAATLEEAGSYDLEGLFIRINHAVDKIKAKRIVLDTIENIFGGFRNTALIRRELLRLFRWLKEKKLTAVITAERGNNFLTRYGLEEYVSDCVIKLDHRVVDEKSIRRIRVLKYRGSYHETNEYPFLIDDHGISVLPITSLKLNHKVSSKRISSGIPELDVMLSGKGYYRGSSVLISGTAGTGKSSFAAHFVNSVCSNKERALYISFEESPGQIIRNMRSIGLDQKKLIDDGLLKINSVRSHHFGLEKHLLSIIKEIDQLKPAAVVVDPINCFLSDGNDLEVKVMITRLIDSLKEKMITACFTSLTSGGTPLEQTDVAVSSLIDTWLLLRDFTVNNTRTTGLYILKSRGMPHSKKVKKVEFTNAGIKLIESEPEYEGQLI